MRAVFVASCVLVAGLAVAAVRAPDDVDGRRVSEDLLQGLGTRTADSETLVSEIASRAVDPEKLVTSRQAIWTFALDGRHLAWITEDEVGTLHIRALNTGRAVTIKRIVAGSAQGDGLESPVVVANGRALWRASNDWSNQQYGFFVRTASIDDPVVRDLPCCDLYVDESRVDFPEFPIAGRGDMLVYYSHWDTSECFSGPTCSERAVRRVLRRSDAAKLFDVDNPSFLAVDGGRIAVVWARSRKGELRSAQGDVLGSFTLERRPRSIALTHSFLAVMTNGGQIELFSANSGSSLGVLRVPWRTAPMLAASGDWLAFAVGRTITAVKLGSNQTTRVRARAARRPSGLAVSGRNLAWRERLPHGDRIQVLVLPR